MYILRCYELSFFRKPNLNRIGSGLKTYLIYYISMRMSHSRLIGPTVLTRNALQMLS